MKRILFIFGFLLFTAGQFCFGQYSISGYLDTPEKNKRVYLSLLKYDEENTIYLDQILTSTLTDSLGYFSFEGKLLSEKHGLYRIHSRVIEDESPMQMAHNEDIKNMHNFVFSNNDTIVFEKNKKYWFSTNTNTNPVDKEWQEFSNYVYRLNQELTSTTDFNLRKKSSAQILSELKSYAKNKEVHPLVTLILISGVQENVLKEDYKSDHEFYLKLQDGLNGYYNNSSYALQFKDLMIDLSKNQTQHDLEFYKRLTIISGGICLLLLITVIFLLLKLKRKMNEKPPQENINLTNQEERIADLIVQDKTNKEIATELFVSLSTVKTHIRNIYAKLEVNNRQEFIDKLKNHTRD
ncbi:response regulator transcription factor [Winogradskyella aquimaris]|uniref:LuxR C-terminal-related transcriptional regulator n=1 Tax=Winogradskyella aquimaris TaxID=864074 RepID=A0ABU5EPD8_9FLAO|nr:LuxR C-terminal-related transcriptional regulator [Winogradskyella aquimaris]MDY2588324.1 LuxR C-terminal-related transcriptional regulator [Winogradskyella aquimaris]